MKRILNYILGIINFFVYALVLYKIYGYYHTEVGFYLPELTFLNTLAIAFIVGIFTTNISNTIMVYSIYSTLNEADDKNYNDIIHKLTKLLTILIIWLGSWIWWLILY